MRYDLLGVGSVRTGHIGLRSVRGPKDTFE